MPLDQKDIQLLCMKTALADAPRPTPSPDAVWMVAYMDWFFQRRANAMRDDPLAAPSR